MHKTHWHIGSMKIWVSEKFRDQQKIIQEKITRLSTSVYKIKKNITQGFSSCTNTGMPNDLVEDLEKFYAISQLAISPYKHLLSTVFLNPDIEQELIILRIITAGAVPLITTARAIIYHSDKKLADHL